jgi:hypothetical protein
VEESADPGSDNLPAVREPETLEEAFIERYGVSPQVKAEIDQWFRAGGDALTLLAKMKADPMSYPHVQDGGCNDPDCAPCKLARFNNIELSKRTVFP